MPTACILLAVIGALGAFSRIILRDDEIRTGTLMRYERTVLGMTIRGFGRYTLHRPMRQSTFELRSERGSPVARHKPAPPEASAP